MLEGLICPTCENTIEEIDLKDSLKCPNCKIDLKNRKYLDFLEFLMANGIVENLDFFDQDVYSDDVDDLDQTKEEEGDPSEYEKKKDVLTFMKMNYSPRMLKRMKRKVIQNLMESMMTGRSSMNGILKKKLNR